jgi:outer membrane immunogenic protein
MTLGRSSLLALAVVTGLAAGAPIAAADGPGKGFLDTPWRSWSGLYGGVNVGSIDAWWDDGFIGGVQLGKNWQSGKIVYGIEGDLSLSGADSVDWVGTIRGRLGYLLSPGILVYGTAGVGFVDFAHGGNETELVLGFGVEGKISETTTLRLEYLNFDDTDIDVVRVGLNWKLNWW